MIRADIWLTDPASILEAGAFGEGALIRLERSDDDGDTYEEITTLAIVATTVSYQFWDEDGDETSLYQWRVSDSDDEIHSPYSASFAGTNPAASIAPVSYATIEQALAHFETDLPPARAARLGTLLEVATGQVNEQLRTRVDYFRHSTETWTLDVNRRSDVLHCHDGLVSVETVEYSTDGGDTYTELEADEWVLRGANPRSSARTPADEPSFHILLTGSGLRSFPPGLSAARITGVPGWPSIPTPLVEATAQRARQLLDAEASYSGSAAGGLDQFGRPATTDRFWPQSLWNFLKAEGSRFRACVAPG